jgi:hypothetical protein
MAIATTNAKLQSWQMNALPQPHRTAPVAAAEAQAELASGISITTLRQVPVIP